MEREYVNPGREGAMAYALGTRDEKATRRKSPSHIAATIARALLKSAGTHCPPSLRTKPSSKTVPSRFVPRAKDVRARLGGRRERGPESENQRLFSKVREGFGVAKSGSCINAHNERVLKSIGVPVTEFDGHEYVWRKDQDPREYESHRTNGASSARDIAEIPYEEIQATIVQPLLENRGHATVKALRAMVLHHLGFRKLGRVIRETLDLAMDEALARGVAERAQRT